MKKIKDLILFEDEVHIKKTEKKNDENLILEIDKGIVNKDVTEEEENEIISKEGDNNKKNIKGVTKYMKYEDGKVKYIKENNNEMTVEGKIKSVINKDKLVNGLERRKKFFDLNKFANIALILFLILSSIFVYVYYFNDENISITDKNSNYSIMEDYNKEVIMNNKNDSKTNDTGKGDVNNSANVLIKETVYNNMNEKLEEINSKEFRKINDYLNLKANRGSVITSIDKNKDSKEKIYFTLIENQDLFKNDQELYDSLEYDIIKSIAFSEELVEAFKGSSTKTSVIEILNKYTMTN